jgi:RiboL-PSP-HEPN
MSTSPSLVFRDSLTEVHQLMEIHTRLTGTGPGRRHQVEVLNKSAVLFACAAFEAFVETLATDAFTQIVATAKDHSALPKPMLRSIAALLKEDKNDIKIWDLAGTGWRSVCERYKEAILRKHVGPFNTPKPHNIEALVRDLIGLPDLPTAWKWPGMIPTDASTRLKQFVELRGALAHGEKPPPKVGKRDVERFLTFLAPLSVRSSNHVRDYCHSVTGKYPWPSVYIGKIR